jgi:hypothetical protein
MVVVLEGPVVIEGNHKSIRILVKLMTVWSMWSYSHTPKTRTITQNKCYDEELMIHEEERMETDGLTWVENKLMICLLLSVFELNILKQYI